GVRCLTVADKRRFLSWMQAYHITIDRLPRRKRPHLANLNRLITSPQHPQAFLVFCGTTKQHDISRKLLFALRGRRRFLWRSEARFLRGGMGLFHEYLSRAAFT